MARPKKIPTKTIRLSVKIINRMKKNAKRRNMSVPDYMAWRLSR